MRRKQRKLQRQRKKRLIERKGSETEREKDGKRERIERERQGLEDLVLGPGQDQGLEADQGLEGAIGPERVGGLGQGGLGQEEPNLEALIMPR